MKTWENIKTRIEKQRLVANSEYREAVKNVSSEEELNKLAKIRRQKSDFLDGIEDEYFAIKHGKDSSSYDRYDWGDLPSGKPACEKIFKFDDQIVWISICGNSDPYISEEEGIDESVLAYIMVAFISPVATVACMDEKGMSEEKAFKVADEIAEDIEEGKFVQAVTKMFANKIIMVSPVIGFEPIDYADK